VWSEAYNGQSAWRHDSRDGLRTLTGPEAVRVQTEAVYRNDRFIAYKKEKTRAVLLGRDQVRGRPAFVVELTSRDGIKRKVFFDAASYLVLKEEQQTEAGAESLLFDDYRPVDGIMEPHNIERRLPDRAVHITVERVTHNVGVNDQVFNFPTSAGDPLPDAGPLFVEALQNQDKIDKAVEYYAYTETEIKKEIDNTGRIKVAETNVYEVFHLDGDPVRKLVKKNGRELSEKEKREEDERIQEIIRDHEKDKAEEAKRRAKEERKRQEQIAKGKQPKADDPDDEDFEIAQFLRISQFTNPRRERFRGRDVIVFDFGPKPDFKPKNRTESLISKLVGVAWIDEKQRRVTRLEARFNDNMKFGAGLLASLHKGSAFVFEQDLINNEAWLPTYREINMSARVLLFKGLKMFATWQFSDYKKFSVESDYKIKQPQQD
jgi:hypothetical protein